MLTYILKIRKEVLDVSPGITDVASIKYKNENDLLEKAEDPEKYYIEKIMPDKIKLNLEYINERSFFKDFKVILRTLSAVISE
jgi:lipopolysaccharide/colanic/teichoic acid biosynthesis glycosyltransferase